MHIITWCLVVLQSDHILGPFLEPLEEVDHQVADVFRVGRLECELLVSHCDQGEGLREGLVAPGNIMVTLVH